MKYMLMMHAPSAEGLAEPGPATVVRVGTDGRPVTDGVFPEAKEFLAGF